MRRHFRLRTLGQLSLVSVAGEIETPGQVRPRHLAVLTVLALTPRAVPRDVLLEMFWGGETESRARHSLSNALSGLRALLGADAVTARRDLVELDAGARLEVDVLQFAAACDVRDDVRAATLYGGPLLTGIYVADAPAFDTWVNRERSRYERLFVDLCDRHVPSLERAGRWADATPLAERWLDTAPRSKNAMAAVLRTHAGPGTPAAVMSALQAFDRIRATAAEYDISIDPSINAFVASLHQRDAAPAVIASDVTPVILSEAKDLAPADRSEVTPFVPDRIRSRTSFARSATRWSMVALAGAIVAVAVAAWSTRRNAIIAAESKQPIVAVTSIDDIRGDTTLDWLRLGLPRMIAADLGSMGGVEIVAPSRVRDVVVRLAGTSSAHLSEDQAIDVARRVGATWAITGGISKAQDGYLLDVAMHDVRGGKPPESFTLMSSNPIELGRLAAARLAMLLDAVAGTTPRYSGIETTNPEAYRHFVRGSQASDAEQSAVAARELDAAIALDSDFVEALRARRSLAEWLGDTATARVIGAVSARRQGRPSEFERLSDALRSADSSGEAERADAISKHIIERFPHDPRSFSARADLLTYRGRWAAAESVLVRELALDSSAMVAGDGPCTPCEVLWRLSRARLAVGDREGAEAAARRWVALQPDLPGAWRNLSATLAAVGRSAESVDAGLHLVALSNNQPTAVDFGRTMLVARRFDIVDSLIASWRTKPNDAVLADGILDLGVMLARERGQLAASLGYDIPADNGLSLVRAVSLAESGNVAEARRIFEHVGHPPGSSRNGQLTPTEARGFSWAHALEADVLARAGDTTAARALADSIRKSGAQSYYDRDKVLYHHVLGVLFAAQHRYGEAERELRAGEWSVQGWTRTNIELARVQIAEGHYTDALTSLRGAQLAPEDAMSRYVSHSEIDWWMARAFALAGQTDSARVYAQYARDAWRHADPRIRARLDSLPRSLASR